MKKLLAIIMFAALGPKLFGADLRLAQKNNRETMSSLRKVHNLPGIKFDFSSKEIAFQTYKYPGTVSFHEAANAAMDSFIHDTNMNTGPLSLIIMDIGKEAGKKYIYNALNDSHAIFGSWNEDSSLRPLYSESLEKNWIFYLILDGMNMIFWAIVDREGKTSTYNYGY